MIQILKKISQQGLNNLNHIASHPTTINLATGVTLMGGVVTFFNYSPYPADISQLIRDAIDALRDHTQAVRENTEAIRENTEAIQQTKSNESKSWFQKVFENIQLSVEFNNEMDSDNNNSSGENNTVGKDDNVECIQGDNPQRRMR